MVVRYAGLDATCRNFYWQPVTTREQGLWWSGVASEGRDGHVINGAADVGCDMFMTALNGTLLGIQNPKTRVTCWIMFFLIYEFLHYSCQFYVPSADVCEDITLYINFNYCVYTIDVFMYVLNIFRVLPE